MTNKRHGISRGFVLCLSLLTTACQQEMARQPSYRPLEPTDFFDDGRASRPLVEGTVPRGRPMWSNGYTFHAARRSHSRTSQSLGTENRRPISRA